MYLPACHLSSAVWVYRFELRHQHPETRKTVLWGGSCMALLQGGSGQGGAACLIGTEGGAVFRCSLEIDGATLQAFAQVLLDLCFTTEYTENKHIHELSSDHRQSCCTLSASLHDLYRQLLQYL